MDPFTWLLDEDYVELDGLTFGPGFLWPATTTGAVSELAGQSFGETVITGQLQEFISAVGETEVLFAYLDNGTAEAVGTSTGETVVTGTLASFGEYVYEPLNYPLGEGVDESANLIADMLEILYSARTEVTGQLELVLEGRADGETTVTGVLDDPDSRWTGSSFGETVITAELFVDGIAELAGTSTGETVVYHIGDLEFDAPSHGFTYYMYGNVGVGFDPTDTSATADSQTFPDGDIIRDFSRYLYQYVNVGVGFGYTDDVSSYDTFFSQSYPDGDIVRDFSRYLYQYVNLIPPITPPDQRLTIGPAPRGHKDLTPTPRPPRRRNR